jgi:PAS domain S-box-containing protein
MGEKLIDLSVRDRSWLWRYSIAIISVAAALGLRFAMAPWMGNHLPYLTFILAVAVTVWLGGFRPAMLAIAICIPAALIFVIPSLDPAASTWFAQTGVVVMYSGVMVAIALLGRTLTQARVRAETAASEAKTNYQELQRETAERHHAVEEVVRAKLEWERTFDSVPDLVAIVDNQHQIVRVNLAMAKRLGLAPDQCVGLLCHQAIHGSDAPPSNCPHQLTLADGQSHTTETHEARLEGDFLVTTTPLLDPQGRVAGTVRVARDITERKRAEELLRQNEQRLQATFDNAGMGIIEVDEHIRITAANNRACEILGYSRDKLIGLTPKDLTTTEDLPLSEDLNTQLLEGSQTRLDYQKRYLRGDGNPVWGHVTVTPIRDANGHFVRAVATFEDISERVRMEETLRQSKERLQATFDNAGMGIGEVDAQIRFIAVNTRLCEILGYPREELLGKSVHELTAPEDRSLSDDLNEQLVEGRLPRLDYEKRYLRPDGKPVWVHLTVTPICDSGGRIVRAIGTFDDISNRILIEEMLRQSKERLQGTFDNAGMGIMEVDAQFHIIAANNRVCEILGYGREELTGMPMRELVAAEDRWRCDDLAAQILAGGLNHADYQKRFLRRCGKSVWAHVTVTAIRDPDGAFIRAVGTFEDISDRIRTEEMLRQTADELARSNHDLEQFAYVASHDLQEPLRMVSGHLQVIEDRLKDKLDQDTRQSMSFAVDGAKRMQEMIRDLLAFSRAGRKGEGFLPTDMEKVLATVTADLAAAIAEAGATVEHDPLPTVQAERVQMTQLLQNLVGNAIKYRAKDRKPKIKIAAAPEEHGWVFSVRDNGIGIDPKHSQRVFEIFQRLHTHQDYPGTGIGLAVCKRIVEFHGGRIWVESSPDEGATFFFSIPDSKRQATENTEDSEVKSKIDVPA